MLSDWTQALVGFLSELVSYCFYGSLHKICDARSNCSVGPSFRSCRNLGRLPIPRSWIHRCTHFNVCSLNVCDGVIYDLYFRILAIFPIESMQRCLIDLCDVTELYRVVNNLLFRWILLSMSLFGCVIYCTDAVTAEVLLPSLAFHPSMLFLSSAKLSRWVAQVVEILFE